MISRFGLAALATLFSSTITQACSDPSTLYKRSVDGPSYITTGYIVRCLDPIYEHDRYKVAAEIERQKAVYDAKRRRRLLAQGYSEADAEIAMLVPSQPVSVAYGLPSYRAYTGPNPPVRPVPVDRPVYVEIPVRVPSLDVPQEVQQRCTAYGTSCPAYAFDSEADAEMARMTLRGYGVESVLLSSSGTSGLIWIVVPNRLSDTTALGE